MITNRYFIFIISNLSLTYALYWNSSGCPPHKKSVISLRDTYKSPEINLCNEQQIIILRDDIHSDSIIVNCFTARYFTGSHLSLSFCSENDGCIITHTLHGEIKKWRSKGIRVSSKADFGTTIGIKLKITISTQQEDSSGLFYCRAVDSEYKFAIQSSSIEIRDLLYWNKNLIKNTDNAKVLFNVTTVPIEFPCFQKALMYNSPKPKWIEQEIYRPTKWSICALNSNKKGLKEKDKMTFSKCEKFTVKQWTEKNKTFMPRDISKMNWTYHVNDKGNLIIFDSPEKESGDKTYAFMCYLDQNLDIHSFSTYLRSYDGNYMEEGIRPQRPTNFRLSPISPQLQNMTLYARKKRVNVDNPAIYIIYSYSPKSEAYWYHNGQLLEDDLYRKKDKYKVTFKDDITMDMGGNYTLVVKNQKETLKFTILVSVVGPPMLIDPNCLPEYKYVWENENVSLTCSYKYKSKLAMKINEIEIPADLQVAQERLAKNYPHLNQLNYIVNFYDQSDSSPVSLQYNASLLTRSNGQIQYQDHSVTFIAQNNLGFKIKSTSIYVIPRVKSQISQYPSSFICPQTCSSIETHRISCRFSPDEYLRKSLIVHHYWTVNSHRIDNNDNCSSQFESYFQMDPLTKDLTISLKNVNTSSREAQLLKETKDYSIICHIEILLQDGSREKQIYNSKFDPHVNAALQIQLKFDFQPLVTATVYGIIIFGIILILLILIFIIIYNRHRDKNQTYKFDKIDIELGYDRDKEIENEKFKPYQPHEEQHEDIDSGSENTSDKISTSDSVHQISPTWNESVSSDISTENV